jgi:hypothetical protein
MLAFDAARLVVRATAMRLLRVKKHGVAALPGLGWNDPRIALPNDLGGGRQLKSPLLTRFHVTLLYIPIRYIPIR